MKAKLEKISIALPRRLVLRWHALTQLGFFRCSAVALHFFRQNRRLVWPWPASKEEALLDLPESIIVIYGSDMASWKLASIADRQQAIYASIIYMEEEAAAQGITL